MSSCPGICVTGVGVISVGALVTPASVGRVVAGGVLGAGVLLHPRVRHSAIAARWKVVFTASILRARRNRWRVGLMFIDLDGFKQVNDRLGHAAGDTLLIEIAKRLKNSLRSSDTLARMGGDEFVVLLEQAGTDGEIAEVAQKLLIVIQAPFEAFGGERLVSASFGVAIYPVDALDQQGLLTHADSAMYRAKASAESHVVFYRPPTSEVPSLNRSLDVAAVIEAVASSLPSSDAPLQ